MCRANPLPYTYFLQIYKRFREKTQFILILFNFAVLRLGWLGCTA